VQCTKEASALGQSMPAQLRGPRTLPLELLSPLIALTCFLPFVRRGPDYSEYLLIYESSTVRSVLAEPPFELGAALLFAFGRGIGLPFQGFIYLISLVALSIKLHVARKLLGNASAAFICTYITSFFLLHELIQARVALALAIMLAAVYQNTRSRQIASTALALTAISIHISVAIVALIYVLRNHRKLLLFLTVIPLVAIATNPDTLLTVLDIAPASSEQQRTARYLYELSGERQGINSLSLQVLITVLSIGLLSLTKYRSLLPATSADLLRFFVFVTAISVPIKLLTTQSPVISFRLFELLSAFVPLIQAYAVSLTFRQHPVPSLVMLCLFVGINFLAYGQLFYSNS